MIRRFHSRLTALFIALVVMGSGRAFAVPSLLNHQGRIAVSGVNFNGSGQFKFALVNANGSVTYWSNDGSSTAGSQPTAAVTLTVSNGLYAVLLGNTELTNMTAIAPAALEYADVRLRVWFNDGTKGFQQISPDQRLAAVPYSIQSRKALAADALNGLLSGDVTGGQATTTIADATVTGKLLTGLASTTGIVLGTDTILSAMGKLKGNSALLAPLASPTFTGTVRLPAGTTTAAPMIFTSGSKLTTPVAGALEFDGSQLWVTTTSLGGRKALAFADAPNGAIAVAQLVAAPSSPVIAWGNNSEGQTRVPSLENVIAVAAGAEHSLALTSAGTVVAWGSNAAEQTTVPTAALSGITAIAAGWNHSLALKSDGTVLAWGLNTGGQSTVPVGLSGVIGIGAGDTYSLALKSDGTLVAWGYEVPVTSVPGGATEVASIAAGGTHALALRAETVPVELASLDYAGRLGVGRDPAINTLEVEGTASKTTASNWLANSDRRIKTEIETVTGALETLSQVRLVNFRYTPDYLAAHPGLEDRSYLNVIAQEFAEVFPDHVKSSGETMSDGSPILQVDTYPLTIFTAAAVQELQRENEALKAQLASQEERLLKLEAALQGK